MVKKYDLRTAVIAFFVTLTIFVGGFVVASLFNDYKVELLKQEQASLSRDMESLRLEETYLASLEADRACPLINMQLGRLSEKLDSTSSRLLAYQNSREFGSRFQELKSEYALIQLRAWMQVGDARESCGTDVATVLYFFDIACAGCEQQGYTLDYYKQQLGSRLMVFSIDRELALPIMSLIQEDHGITRSPTLIVGDVALVEPSKEQLQAALCSQYSVKPEFCG